MAKGSGRRSAADISAAVASTLKPTRKLDQLERKVWRRVIDSWPGDYFVASDAQLLVAYCAVCVAFDKQVGAGDLMGMGQGARMMAMLATKLRITPQSRVHQHSAASAARAARGKAPAKKALLGGMDETWQRNGANPN